MRVIFIVIIGCISLVSCETKNEKTHKKTQSEIISEKMNETFPFSENGKIELLSYKDRRLYTRNIYEDSIYYDFIKDNDKIVERIALNKNLSLELYKLYFTKQCSDTESAACYDPRHSIVFYNGKSEIIGSIEVCFNCGTKMIRGKVAPKGDCRDNDDKLSAIFKEAGIKYFGENE